MATTATAKPAQKYFTIIAGRKEPATALQGTLDKKTGMPTPNTNKVLLPVGRILVPNYSRVWGRRVIDPQTSTTGKSTTVSPPSVAVSDPKYRGKIEFLEYGAEGGEMIEIRYLRNSSSLDKQYQDTVQKIKPTDEDAFIALQQGINDFSEATEALLIQFLTHHSLMHESISRDNTMTDYDMVVYDAGKRNKSRIEKVVIKNTAEGYVLDAAGNKEKTHILASIFNIDTQLQDDIIVEKLLDRANEFSERFVEAINQYQKKAHILLQDADDAGVIDIEPQGAIHIVDLKGGKDILISNVDSRGIEKIKQVVANSIIDLPTFTALDKLDKTLKEFRKQTVK